MKEAFIEYNPTQKTRDLIALVDDILTEYVAQGYRLTLRQLFYQLVSRGHIENTQRMYKNLGGHVGNARLAGLLDWNAIEDRARSTQWASHWRDPAQIVRAAAESFRIDKWENQPRHIEVMCEKDALSGVIGPACAQEDVRFTANRGYSSLSHFYRIGKRLMRQGDWDGKQIIIFYFGDHDPSGLDMDRDIVDRLGMFSGLDIEFERLSLTMDQIEQYNPPPDPAKVSDSRYDSYVMMYGAHSWELDAMEPAVLTDLVGRAIRRSRDEDLWEDALAREADMRNDLQEFADNYEENND